ncbi:hypothetical protein CNE_BB1p08530 (plasmid) [Cupriavidus necator N-1]|uniref:Uncharacterized protein n=1 Tax=Cupriavidus necator (strain ATCC 43291 / DSM 13513 / CCUG 52238 / LMG 8453 / N-1) TaxID=1042878 RepID=F8GU63_CUPNN|nr:hypothetical protein CNE_BB1p08530 [Cupriavidus necator N-1]
MMRGDEQAPHEAACLRPFCCNPFGALSAALSAYAGVGGWTPPLPDAIGKDERGDA